MFNINYPTTQSNPDSPIKSTARRSPHEKEKKNFVRCRSTTINRPARENSRWTTNLFPFFTLLGSTLWFVFAYASRSPSRKARFSRSIRSRVETTFFCFSFTLSSITHGKNEKRGGKEMFERGLQPTSSICLCFLRRVSNFLCSFFCWPKKQTSTEENIGFSKNRGEELGWACGWYSKSKWHLCFDSIWFRIKCPTLWGAFYDCAVGGFVSMLRDASCRWSSHCVPFYARGCFLLPALSSAHRLMNSCELYQPHGERGKVRNSIFPTRYLLHHPTCHSS